jgi:hypothetical protein
MSNKTVCKQTGSTDMQAMGVSRAWSLFEVCPWPVTCVFAIVFAETELRSMLSREPTCSAPVQVPVPGISWQITKSSAARVTADPHVKACVILCVCALPVMLQDWVGMAKEYEQQESQRV